MNKISSFIIFPSILITLGFFGFTLSVHQDEGLTMEDYSKKVTAKDTAVLVYFNADWCVPCVKLKPVIAELEKENPKTKFLKLDVDANPKVALHFEINTLPLFFIYKNGKQVWTNNTYLSKKDLQGKLTYYR